MKIAHKGNKVRFYRVKKFRKFGDVVNVETPAYPHVVRGFAPVDALAPEHAVLVQPERIECLKSIFFYQMFYDMLRKAFKCAVFARIIFSKTVNYLFQVELRNSQRNLCIFRIEISSFVFHLRTSHTIQVLTST